MEWIKEALQFATLGVEKDIITRLFIAFVFGAVLGFERSLKRKNASIKTTIVITVTAALTTIVSLEAAKLYAEAYSTPMDPLRLSAQLISGVGFIGAGLIMARTSTSISGLTSAALILSAISIGIAVGSGFYKEALFALVFMMIGIEIMPKLAKKLAKKTLTKKRVEIKLILKDDVVMSEVLKTMKSFDLELGHVNIRDIKGGQHELKLQALVYEKTYVTDIYEKLKTITWVEKTEVNGL